MFKLPTPRILEFAPSHRGKLKAIPSLWVRREGGPAHFITAKRTKSARLAGKIDHRKDDACGL